MRNPVDLVKDVVRKLSNKYPSFTWDAECCENDNYIKYVLNINVNEFFNGSVLHVSSSVDINFFLTDCIYPGVNINAERLNRLANDLLMLPDGIGIESLMFPIHPEYRLTHDGLYYLKLSVSEISNRLIMARTADFADRMGIHITGFNDDCKCKSISTSEA